MIGTQISFLDSVVDSAVDSSVTVDSVRVEKISKKEIDKKKNGNNPFLISLKVQIIEKLYIRFDKHCRREYGEIAEDVRNKTIEIFMETYDIKKHKSLYAAYKFLWGTAYRQNMKMTISSKNVIPVNDEEYENAKWDEMHKFHVTKNGKIYMKRQVVDEIAIGGAASSDTTDPLIHIVKSENKSELIEKIKLLPKALRVMAEKFFHEGIEPRKEVWKKIVAELRKVYGLEAQQNLCLN